MTSTESRTRWGTGTPGRTISVAVVDPVPLYREGMSSLVLRTAGLRWAGGASGLAGALSLVRQVRPDLVFMDSALDPRHSLDTLLTGQDGVGERPVVVMLVRQAHRTPAYVAEALAAGVSGLVPRAGDPALFIAAARRACAMGRYVDPELIQPSARGEGVDMPLSRREQQVLSLISEGLDNGTVGARLFIAAETVRSHVKSILRKLHARDRAHAVAIGFRLGLLAGHRDAPSLPPALVPAQVVPRVAYRR
jgi:DNA-binding NarL/FixJ family response regulator